MSKCVYVPSLNQKEPIMTLTGRRTGNVYYALHNIPVRTQADARRVSPLFRNPVHDSVLMETPQDGTVPPLDEVMKQILFGKRGTG